MTNSAKTPSGKAKKGQVTVRPDGNSIKACFPRTHFPGEPNQKKLKTGISNVDGWETKAQALTPRLQLAMEDWKLTTPDGKFDEGKYREILIEQKLIPDLKIVESATTSDGQLPPKPQLSLMEVWDMYCEYRKQGLRESFYEGKYQGRYKNHLQSAIEATKTEDAIKIRNWLVENRNHKTVKAVLSNLSKAYLLGMKQKLLSHNPYEGMSEEIVSKGAQGKTQNEVEIEADNDVLDRGKAYTWDEAQIILDYVQVNYPYWFNFLKFKFLTGCRTGEAIAMYWGDIEWDKERVLIRRTYDRVTKKFYPLKNDRTYKGEETRRFPMPKDEELWNFLKSIPQGEPNEVVFKSKLEKTINDTVFAEFWRGRKKGKCNRKGIITQLIEQGKLTKYLSPYNTRHTYITHAVFDLGIDEKKVSYWCGHKIEVSNKHYQDVAIFADKTNPHLPATTTQQVQQQSEIDLLREQMKQQQELINKLLQDRDK
ncbi:tyrosine-type recombinase/integrase [Nostoc sp. NMS4]|uniref:site-specific integrase n=1 Tax=Nostoc sp. NMS4 TaxID=2815390 RepID=UPI0025D031B7|nr:tyrosine-type recombinase/integrase [Nostoc sp. NMS4]MBN3927370.1 tyrosine-type recombinase/integrase [Nostoc sp. NMS4]